MSTGRPIGAEDKEALVALTHVESALRRAAEMVEGDRPIVELIKQLVATREAFDAAADLILDRRITEQLRHVFRQAQGDDQDDPVVELMKILKRARS